MIDSVTVDKIFAAADIVDIIGDFVQLRKKGVNYGACCPFHNEKTPSFVVSPSKGYFKCFGCGASGNAIGFIMKHESLSYVDALRYVAKKYNIEIVETAPSAEQIKIADEKESMMALNMYAESYFVRQLNETAEGRNIALAYFRERGFSDATIEKFKLGYCLSSGDSFSLEAKSEGYKEEFMVGTGLTIKREQGGYYDRFTGRVIFPITSFTGRTIGFGGRIMRSDKKAAKYLNSPESIIYHKSDTLYGISQSKRAISVADKAILVEGYTDVISLHQAGIENVVASSGTSLTQGQVQLIKRLTNNVTVIYDGDAAGIKASLRGIDIILKEGVSVRVVLMPDGDDPDSFARKHTTEELTEYINQNEVDFLTFKSKLLIGEVKNDPIGRAKVISDVVDSITIIPDEIAQSQYIAECAKLLNADIDVVKSEVARRKAVMLNGAVGANVEANRRKKENIVKRSLEQVKVVDSSKAQLHKLETELLDYLLFYGEKVVYIQEEGMEEAIEVNVSELIFSELDIDEIELDEGVNRKIFNLYRSLFTQCQEAQQSEAEQTEEDNQKYIAVDITKFINNSDGEISSLVVDMISQKENYVASKLWSQMDISAVDIENSLGRAIPKALALYKQKVVEGMLQDLTAALPNCTSVEESLEMLKKMQALETTRKSICLKFQRIK
ncbi:MAG: DNA primase [Rikenellaceae bacterium]